MTWSRQVIKYLGSKRLIAPRIAAALCSLPGIRRVADLFSGTARVGHALKQAGFEVYASDQLRFAAVLARCYVAADARVWLGRARELIAHLSTVRPQEGYFTETFCVKSRYFQPHNGARVDAIREEIARLSLPPELEAIALTSLMEAADRADSTAGVQMAYLKEWAERSYKQLELRLPKLLPGPGHAQEGEAETIAPTLDVDAAYLDPPYNQHSYLGNYHIWETLCRWDKPEHYGTACKRMDAKLRKSRFNQRQKIRPALREVIRGLRCPWVVLSSSDEGYLTAEEITALLSEKGHVGMVEIPYRRYVGAQIGIYNPQGDRVGEVSHLRNHEFLFVAGPEADAVEAAAEAARLAGDGRPAGIGQVGIPLRP